MSVYMIGAVEIHDPEGYELYRANVPPTLTPYLGKYETLSSDDNPLVLVGNQPANHLFINRYSSMDVLKEFYYSDAYQSVKHYRLESSTTSFIFAMKGLDEGRHETGEAAYMFAALEINDMDEYGVYRQHATKAIAAFPEMSVLSADDHPLMLEGTQPANHLVLARFASVERASEFYDSALYQVATRHRVAASDARFYMVMRSSEKAS